MGQLAFNMCKIKGVTLGIKDLNFTAHRGKMSVRLTDGREVIVPVSFFPDIQQMPVCTRCLLSPCAWESIAFTMLK